MNFNSRIHISDIKTATLKGYTEIVKVMIGCIDNLMSTSFMDTRVLWSNTSYQLIKVSSCPPIKQHIIRQHFYLLLWYVASKDDKTTLLFSGHDLLLQKMTLLFSSMICPLRGRQDKTTLLFTGMMYCFIRQHFYLAVWCALHKMTRQHFYLMVWCAAS